MFFMVCGAFFTRLTQKPGNQKSVKLAGRDEISAKV